MLVILLSASYASYSTFLNSLSYSVFLTASFVTTPFSLIKSTGAVSNLPLSNLSTLPFKLFKPLGTIQLFINSCFKAS